MSVLNDVSTNLDEPLQFLDKKKSFDTPKEVQTRVHPNLKPLELPTGVTAEQAYELIKTEAAKQARWIIVKTDDATKSVQVLATTLIFRFKDDAIFQVKIEGEKVIVHARSASRVGRGDLGANAKRINSFFAVLLSAAKKLKI